MALKRITSIDIISFATFMAIVQALIGVFYGLLIAVAGSFVTALLRTSSEVEIPSFGAAFGILGIIFFPILFFIIGFVVGVIGALVINLTLKIIKGLKFEMED